MSKSKKTSQPPALRITAAFGSIPFNFSLSLLVTDCSSWLEQGISSSLVRNLRGTRRFKVTDVSKNG